VELVDTPDLGPGAERCGGPFLHQIILATCRARSERVPVR